MISEKVNIMILIKIIAFKVIVGIIIGIIIVVFSTRKIGDTPYILVVSCENEETENAAYELIKEDAKKSLLKSKSVNKIGIELTYEVRIKDDNTSFVNKISAVDGITNAVLVSYNGEYMS